MRRSAIALSLLALAQTACWEQVSRDWFPQMKRQLAVQAYEENALYNEEFGGQRQGFTPPDGTVPVSYAGVPDLTSMDLATQDAVPNPVAPTLASLQRGQVLFDRYCRTCHGPEGKGDGPVAGPPFGTGPFGLVLPIGGPSSLARALTDGHIYTTISLGRGRMPNYSRISPEDRWNVVNYVRELNGGRP
jgi:mono/diheme cytochrome c family protein